MYHSLLLFHLTNDMCCFQVWELWSIIWAIQISFQFIELIANNIATGAYDFEENRKLSHWIPKWLCHSASLLVMFLFHIPMLSLKFPSLLGVTNYNSQQTCVGHLFGAYLLSLYSLWWGSCSYFILFCLISNYWVLEFSNFYLMFSENSFSQPVVFHSFTHYF